MWIAARHIDALLNLVTHHNPKKDLGEWGIFLTIIVFSNLPFYYTHSYTYTQNWNRLPLATVSTAFAIPPASMKPTAILKDKNYYFKQRNNWYIPKIIDTIMPRNITTVCTTSVQMTALIPPYHLFEEGISNYLKKSRFVHFKVHDLHLQYSYKLYKPIRMIQLQAKCLIQSLDSMPSSVHRE